MQISWMSDSLIAFLENLVRTVPLPSFVLIGSFIEEVVTPLPAVFVTTLAGSLASTNERTILYIFLLALVGSAGKTLATTLYYIVGDKGEDFLVKRIGKYVGVTHELVEGIGRRLTKDWRDDFVLFLLRAIPIAPTGSVSLLCGVIKVNFRSFLISTFAGYFVRSFLLLWFGFAGIDVLKTVEQNSVLQLGMKAGGFLLLCLTFFLLYKNKKQIMRHLTKQSVQ